MNWRIFSCIMPASSPQISLCLLSEHAGVTHVVTIQSLPKCLPTHHPLLKLPPFCHPLKSTVSASSSVSLIFTFACFHSCTWARVPYRAQPPFPPLSRLRCSRHVLQPGRRTLTLEPVTFVLFINYLPLSSLNECEFSLCLLVSCYGDSKESNK